MIDQIVKRDGRLVPFTREKISQAIFSAAVAVGGHDRSVAEHVANDVLARLEARQEPDTYPTVEEVQDIVEKCLIEGGHAKTAKAYIIYRYEHTLKRAGRRSLTYSSENIPYRKLWQALSWAVDRRLTSLADIRAMTEGGRFGELVETSEEFYRYELEEAVSRILERMGELKIIIVTGPSSSGKTTTTSKVSERLAAHGYTLHTLNVDNYYYDLSKQPRDLHGDYDYETPQAIELDLIAQHLEELLEGKCVQVPHYDFKKGRRTGVSQELRIGERDLILIDSLHGMYEGMTGHIPRERKFALYIETLAQLKDAQNRFVRWTDLRLLRRMVRDGQFRNHNPRQTLLHWHYVRRSELRHITPRSRDADVVVNSSLLYELPILKHRLGHLFPDFVQELGGDSEREDAYGRALRVSELFQEITAWTDESVVPRDSVFREFIGGGPIT
jgi:uridine kinase